VRAIALHTDVIATTSAIWQTNCVAVRSGEESFLIDSPILPAELDALPTLFEQVGFLPPRGLLATHGDWDHLLGRLAFPGLALGCAESTATRMRSAPGEAQRELRDFDEELSIDRPRPLALGAVQELPVPGRCGIGELELELHPAAGHTEDGMAIWIPWGRVLVVGDYLSAVELPSLAEHRGALAGVPPTAAASSPAGGAASPPAAGGAASSPAGGVALPPAAGGAASSPAGGALGAYRATLERLRPLAQSAAHVVPGHGPILDAARALDVLEEDLAYLLALQERGADAELPPGRRTRVQRARHAENVARAQP
jgi:glyoxylase-like metal-dependent hydrolase (beta-lactamase superfamily II)